MAPFITIATAEFAVATNTLVTRRWLIGVKQGKTSLTGQTSTEESTRRPAVFGVQLIHTPNEVCEQAIATTVYTSRFTIKPAIMAIRI